jgi:hypothetical protein
LAVGAQAEEVLLKAASLAVALLLLEAAVVRQAVGVAARRARTTVPERA